MPNSRQISEEQQDIFEDAPIDGTVLISGPPGTGKTVIAFLRAQTIAKKNIDVVVLMYNRVLRRYTENIAKEISERVKSKTMHSWFPRWWRKHRISQSESSFFVEGEKVYLRCPYSEKDKLKRKGGRWDAQKKMWYVAKSRYDLSPTSYSQWTRGSIDPIEIEKWHYDWLAMRDKYVELSSGDCHDWGHLIIDEAQDFSPDMYSFLRFASKKLKYGGATILADENQRLEENYNSSLSEIRTELNIKNIREFKLSKNFRNTRQIAEVARHFYVGLETGIPELPLRNGSKPLWIGTESVEQQVQYIKKYLQYRGALEVGVIVDSEEDRMYFDEELCKELESYKIQSYACSDFKSSESLEFDVQGVVTVLHRRSCKGLEFDTVFIPQLQKYSVCDTEVTTFKMNMYVACSRARTELIFLSNNSDVCNLAVYEHFPSQESGLIEYRVEK